MSIQETHPAHSVENDPVSAPRENGESLDAYGEQSFADFIAHIDESEQIPEETIDAVNAITNISPERLSLLKQETGFDRALTQFKQTLSTIKHGARSAIEKALIATTLAGPSATPVDAFAADIAPPTTTETTTSYTEKTPADIGMEMRERTQPENAPKSVATPPVETTRNTATYEGRLAYIETTGDKAMYEEKLAALRQSAENSPQEQALVVITRKNGSYAFREIPLSSSAGGYVPMPREKEVRESRHVERIHTHPYGLTISQKTAEGTLYLYSYARYMPPSMPDITGSIQMTEHAHVNPENFSERVIDPHGDWTYTIDGAHPFFTQMKTFGEVFLSEVEKQNLLLTEEDSVAIESHGLTDDLIRELGEQELDGASYGEPALDAARKKILAQSALRKTLMERIVPEDYALLQQIGRLTLKITGHDYGESTHAYTSQEKERRETEQQARITELCKLYKQMGIDMQYTPKATPTR